MHFYQLGSTKKFIRRKILVTILLKTVNIMCKHGLGHHEVPVQIQVLLCHLIEVFSDVMKLLGICHYVNSFIKDLTRLLIGEVVLSHCDKELQLYGALLCDHLYK